MTPLLDKLLFTIAVLALLAFGLNVAMQARTLIDNRMGREIALEGIRR